MYSTLNISIILWQNEVIVADHQCKCRRILSKYCIAFIVHGPKLLSAIWTPPCGTLQPDCQNLNLRPYFLVFYVPKSYKMHLFKISLWRFSCYYQVALQGYTVWSNDAIKSGEINNFILTTVVFKIRQGQGVPTYSTVLMCFWYDNQVILI